MVCMKRLFCLSTPLFSKALQTSHRLVGCCHWDVDCPFKVLCLKDKGFQCDRIILGFLYLIPNNLIYLLSWQIKSLYFCLFFLIWSLVFFYVKEKSKIKKSYSLNLDAVKKLKASLACKRMNPSGNCHWRLLNQMMSIWACCVKRFGIISCSNSRDWTELW